jgi:hypothetical protein
MQKIKVLNPVVETRRRRDDEGNLGFYQRKINTSLPRYRFKIFRSGN